MNPDMSGTRTIQAKDIRPGDVFTARDPGATEQRLIVDSTWISPGAAYVRLMARPGREAPTSMWTLDATDEVRVYREEWDDAPEPEPDPSAGIQPEPHWSGVSEVIVPLAVDEMVEQTTRLHEAFAAHRDQILASIDRDRVYALQRRIEDYLNTVATTFEDMPDE